MAANQAPEPPSQKFSQMSGLDKLKFLGKFVVFICSAGFLYPTLLSD